MKNKALIFFFASCIWAESFPVAVFKRPFTMPAGSFETALKFSNESVLNLNFDYGITPHFQLGISWDGMQAPSGATPVPKQAINLTSTYLVFTTPYVSMLGSAMLPVYFGKMVLQEFSSIKGNAAACPVRDHSEVGARTQYFRNPKSHLE